MNKRDVRLNIRISIEERQLLKEAAERTGQNLSDFMRVTSVSFARAVISGDREALKSQAENVSKLLDVALSVKSAS
jgi:uncharacterized protein (DUF1778 family)